MTVELHDRLTRICIFARTYSNHAFLSGFMCIELLDRATLQCASGSIFSAIQHADILMWLWRLLMQTNIYSIGAGTSTGNGGAVYCGNI
jgi:uncharacterized membrane-anchored protein